MGDPQLFVIRVWRQANEFRASVRGVRDAEALLFTAPDRVTEFLRNASETAAASAAGTALEETPAS